MGKRHSAFEDLYAAAIASCLIVFGVMLLKQCGLVTGGIAGITLLLSYATGVSATLLMLIVNLPFFLIAGRVAGAAFGARSFVANLAITLLGMVLPSGMSLEQVNPLLGAFFGGSTIGLGILILARHGAGVGGVGVVALMLQTSKGWNAGKTQLIVDFLVLSAATLLLDRNHLVYSTLSALFINGVLIVNHRPGRYIGY